MHRLGGYTDLVDNRRFLVFWAGQTIGGLGDAIFRVALLLIATEISSSPLVLAAIVGAQTLVSIVLGPIAGVFADRHSRKQLLYIGELLKLLPLLLFLSPLSVSSLIAVAMITAVGGSVLSPARASLVPDLAGEAQYLSAASLNELATSIVHLLGPLLSGILTSSFGLMVFVLLAVIRLVAMTTLVLLGPLPTVVHKHEGQQPGFWRHLREGFAAIAHNRIIVLFISTLLPVMIAIGALNVIQVDYVRNVLAADARQFGLVESLMSVGVLATTFLLGLYGQRQNPAKLLVSSVVLIGAATSVFLLSPSLIFVYCWAFILGASDSLLTLPFFSIIVSETTASLRGRVMSCFESLLRVGVLLGLAIAGIAAAHFGSAQILGSSGLAIFVIGLLARLHPQYAVMAVRKNESADKVVSDAG